MYPLRTKLSVTSTRARQGQARFWSVTLDTGRSHFRPRFLPLGLEISNPKARDLSPVEVGPRGPSLPAASAHTQVWNVTVLRCAFYTAKKFVSDQALVSPSEFWNVEVYISSFRLYSDGCTAVRCTKSHLVLHLKVWTYVRVCEIYLHLKKQIIRLFYIHDNPTSWSPLKYFLSHWIYLFWTFYISKWNNTILAICVWLFSSA